MTEHTPSMTRTTLLIILAAALGGLVYGHDLGIIGPALLFVGQDIPMDTWHQGFLGGCVFGGGALATLISGVLADWFGRKRMIILASLVFCIGIGMAAIAHNFTTLLCGRLVQGIGVGIVTIVTPLYISESAPAYIRGRAICAFQLVLTLSIMLAYAVGRYYSPSHNWRAMFLTALIPGVLLFFGSLLMPRSPRWLVMKNKLTEAKRVLKKTHSPAVAEQEFGAIVDEHLKPKTTLEKMADRRLLLIPLVLVLLAAILTQLTGMNSLLQFGPIIFKQAGMSTHEMAITGGTIVTGINFVITFIALLLVDKIGRRRLLFIGTIGIAIALAFCGAIFLLLPAGHLRGLLFLLGLTTFIISYAIGPGVVVWLVISELLPDRVRSNGMSLALFLNSMTSFLLATFYLKIAEIIGFSGLFWLCGLFALAYTLLTWLCIPETKGKSLAEIAKHFERYRKTTLETAQ